MLLRRWSPHTSPQERAHSSFLRSSGAGWEQACHLELSWQPRQQRRRTSMHAPAASPHQAAQAAAARPRCAADLGWWSKCRGGRGSTGCCRCRWCCCPRGTARRRPGRCGSGTGWPAGGGRRRQQGEARVAWRTPLEAQRRVHLPAAAPPLGVRRRTRRSRRGKSAASRRGEGRTGQRLQDPDKAGSARLVPLASSGMNQPAELQTGRQQGGQERRRGRAPSAAARSAAPAAGRGVGQGLPVW